MKRSLLLSAGAVLIAAAIVFCLLQRASSLSAAPVTIRCSGLDDVRGELRPGMEQHPLLARPLTLWVTNHTEKVVHISITQIEVRVGAVWTNYPLAGPMPSVRFPEGKYVWTSILKPHAAARGIVQEFSMPETSPWRIKVAVAENLVGVSYLVAGVKQFFSVLLTDHRVQNPFPPRVVYLQSREVVSEEILGNPTDNTHPAK